MDLENIRNEDGEIEEEEMNTYEIQHRTYRDIVSLHDHTPPTQTIGGNEITTTSPTPTRTLIEEHERMEAERQNRQERNSEIRSDLLEALDQQFPTQTTTALLAEHAGYLHKLVAYNDMFDYETGRDTDTQVNNHHHRFEGLYGQDTQTSESQFDIAYDEALRRQREGNEMFNEALDNSNREEADE